MNILRFLRVLITPGASAKVSHVRAIQCLDAHASGDWGMVDARDAQMNEQALKTGARLLSVYPIDEAQPQGPKFWIITDATNDDGEREVTTLLLPEEY